MNNLVNVLMLGDGILTIPSVLFLIALIVLIVLSESGKVETLRKAQEKIMELTEKGHDAKLCSKCQGKGVTAWRICPKCGGLGYICKLTNHKEVGTTSHDIDDVQKCANCGRTIGKLEKTYLFESQTVCGECHQKLKNQQ